MKTLIISFSLIGLAATAGVGLSYVQQTSMAGPETSMLSLINDTGTSLESGTSVESRMPAEALFVGAQQTPPALGKTRPSVGIVTPEMPVLAFVRKGPPQLAPMLSPLPVARPVARPSDVVARAAHTPIIATVSGQNVSGQSINNFLVVAQTNVLTISPPKPARIAPTAPLQVQPSWVVGVFR